MVGQEFRWFLRVSALWEPGLNDRCYLLPRLDVSVGGSPGLHVLRQRERVGHVEIQCGPPELRLLRRVRAVAKCLERGQVPWAASVGGECDFDCGVGEWRSIFTFFGFGIIFGIGSFPRKSLKSSWLRACLLAKSQSLMFIS